MIPKKGSSSAAGRPGPFFLELYLFAYSIGVHSKMNSYLSLSETMSCVLGMLGSQRFKLHSFWYLKTKDNVTRLHSLPL